MVKFALLARLEAKAGKEQEVADFIKSALPLAQQETETISWYALQIGPSTFGIFDTLKPKKAEKPTWADKLQPHLWQKHRNCWLQHRLLNRWIYWRLNREGKLRGMPGLFL